MNFFKSFTLLCFLVISLPALALENNVPFVRGVNYDPVHSVEFSYGMGTDNESAMRNAIFHDLDQLKQLEIKYDLNIRYLKTFFTVYSSLHNKYQLNIADTINEWNQKNPDYAFKLALGVYEFRSNKDACQTDVECEEWTQNQIQAAENALLTYKDIALIDRVIVGNEDVSSQGLPTRLTADIYRIKYFIAANDIKNVMVGTAQTSGGVLALYNGTQYQNVLTATDFIGLNIYPFWSGSSYDNNGAMAKATFSNFWTKLKNQKNWGRKPVIETEEGWPSFGNPRASSDAAHDYFYYWYYGHAADGAKPEAGKDSIVPVSYYFALNDKLPGQGIESHWGIFSADGSSNILDDFNSEGKHFANNIVFPTFENHVGASSDSQLVYSLNDAYPIIVTACTEDDGLGACYPLYGYQDSGQIKKIDVNPYSWNTWWAAFTKYKPGTNKNLMLDTSLKYYKSLFIVLNDHSRYPGICRVNSKQLKTLTKDSMIKVFWPKDSVPVECVINN